MKIIVIRHGESIADVLNVIEGRADFELTVNGFKQAVKMSEYVNKNFIVERIYSSTLNRAKQTAQVLSKKTGAEIVFRDRLMEFNNGKIAGLSREVANILYPKDANLAYDESMYEMESLKEFRLRAEVALNDILEDSEGCSVIAIVSHGGLINMLYRCFMRMGYNNDVRYPTGDTGIHIWEVENNDRKILLSNYLDHLN